MRNSTRHVDRRLCVALTAGICLGLGSSQLPAQTPPLRASTEATFTPEQRRADLVVLRTALEQAHPGLLRYATQPELDDVFAAASGLSPTPINEQQFLKYVARILGVVRDDHTYALPSATFWNETLGPTRYGQRSTAGTLRLFPFFVANVNGRLFVTHNNGPLEVPRGTEILTINGRSASDVLAELAPLAPTSGFTTTFRPRHVEQFSPQQEYNGFVVNYALFVDAPERFRRAISGLRLQGDDRLPVSRPRAACAEPSRSRPLH
jgi:hypothetical protein